MDINFDYSDGDDPLRLKAGFILSLFEVIISGGNTSGSSLKPEEKTVIDRCLPLVYRKYFTDPKPENMPVLQDLYDCLKEQGDADSLYLAKVLEIYVTGSLNVFNHRTNINVNNRLICYDIKELGNSLKELGMLILQDQVWGRVTANREARRTTWYYVDEFHMLLKAAQTAAYSVEIWKRFRKWGGIPTGITQNVKDLLSSSEIENILENSDFVYILGQGAGDADILAQKLDISKHQLSYVKQQQTPGEGLIVYGNTIIPCADKFPTDTELYRIMSTKVSEAVRE